MRSFVDCLERKWLVEVHVAGCKRVKALLGIDLPGLVGDGMKGLGELLADPCQLVDVLYVLCKDQADKQGVTDEDFGRSLAGDALGKAAEAFTDALVDFFPSRDTREGIGKAVSKSKEVQKILVAEDLKAIGEIDPAEIARKVREKLLGNSSTTAPESSDLTPAPSPSGP